MTPAWQMTMNFLTCMISQEHDLEPEEVEECSHCDEQVSELQESSGIGTFIVIYTALLGLFLGSNLIPSQMTQGSSSMQRQIELKQQKMQQLQDKWQDANDHMTEEEEAEWLAMRRDVFYDVINNDRNDEDERFEDAEDL